jgi:hypothetical protein
VTTIRPRPSAAEERSDAAGDAADLAAGRLRPRARLLRSLAWILPAAAGLAGLLVFGLDLAGDSPAPASVATVAPAPAATASVARVAPAADRIAPPPPAVAAKPASPAEPPPDSRIAVSPVPAAERPAPPAMRAPLVTLSPEEIAAHLARGEERLNRGELAAARLYFERVALAGDRRGAHGMARTYDPAVLAGLPLLGPQADAAAARLWYGRAESQSAAR